MSFSTSFKRSKTSGGSILLDELPTIRETTKATKQLKRGKAEGVNRISLENWKHGSPALHAKLYKLFISCWDEGKQPQVLHDAVIITLYKNKGNKSNCSNYQRIILFTIKGKILARILLNRLQPTITEQHFPENQRSLRANSRTTNMVPVLQQTQVPRAKQGFM